MIKGLTEIEKYRVIRPLIGSCDFDGYDMPVIRKVSTDAVNWENLHDNWVQESFLKTR